MMCTVVAVDKWAQERSGVCIVNIDRYIQFMSNIEAPTHAHTVDVEICDQDVFQTAQCGALITSKNIYCALIGHYQSILSYIVKYLNIVSCTDPLIFQFSYLPPRTTLVLMFQIAF